MKKINILLVLMLGVLVLTGCSKTIVCNMKVEQGSYTLNSEYKIIYEGDFVKRVETTEQVTSDDADVINQFEEMVNNQLESYKDLKYYNYQIEKKDGVLSEKISIDYTKMDIDKFLEINSDAQSLFSNKKVKYSTILSMYKQLGATCE